MNIELPQNWAGRTQLDIYDLSGRLMQSQSVYTPWSVLYLNHLPNGQYILRIKNSSETISKYFIKMKE